MSAEQNSGPKDELAKWRVEIDAVDHSILELLTQRFEITEEVGRFKAARGMNPYDPTREASQIERISQLAQEYGLDEAMVQSVFGVIRERVRDRHAEIANTETPKVGPSFTLLEQMRIKFRHIHHDPVLTISDVVGIFDLPPSNMVKVMIFHARTPDKYIVAALRGSDKVDWKKLANAARVPRHGLTLVDKEQVESVTGIPLGGLKPFGYDQRFLVIFDSDILKIRTVLCSAGTNTDSLALLSSDLLRVSGGIKASIRQNTGPT
ncbi:MAG: chorismate mutase [Candidatus Blackburnbacteria bacterium]|nr:chorismate mutase [Candidatus Blackburnbacteria bacterium]